MEKKDMKRKPNWSNDEMEALAQAVASNIKVVKGKFTPSLTNDMKNKCWLEITSRVNAANSTETNRDVGDVKKKWQDISSLTKRKEAQRIRERQATGGGPSMEDDAKPWDKFIIGTFTRSALEGVVGGVDTAMQQTKKASSLTALEKEGTSVLEASEATSRLSFIPDKTCTSLSATTEEEAAVSSCSALVIKGRARFLVK
ncbi:uncharacterized protein LOC110442115 [Mizuhopecten yessoensis]|uniref:uncharacterized protein LOC110442115 n=1 Tax=Mizuhopecten yessoensis TaxID=6573 RepID=UPI000B45756A|nr:uncharacterized protein LOC110442115 [Mizuhopecten yessoensis]